MGAAMNLCDFVSAGENCQVEAATLKFARAMYDAKKPLGFF